MARAYLYTPDSVLDLVLERTVDVPPELVWKAWTVPKHLMPWICPLPWTTVECKIDLRPGGSFRTVMQSPEGQKYPNVGCYVEVVEGERLAWTTAMLPGFRPVNPAAPDETSHGVDPFTGVITIAKHGEGTKYTAMAIHSSEARRKAHEAMGFHEGWGAAFNQLVAYARTMA